MEGFQLLLGVAGVALLFALCWQPLQNPGWGDSTVDYQRDVAGIFVSLQLGLDDVSDHLALSQRGASMKNNRFGASLNGLH